MLYSVNKHLYAFYTYIHYLSSVTVDIHSYASGDSEW
jgi:hypothetical protein